MRLIGIVLILGIHFQNIDAHDLVVQLTKVECLNLNTHYLREFKCLLCPGKNYQSYFSAQYVFNRDAANITGEFLLKIMRNGKEDVMSKFSFDYCQTLSAANGNYLMKMVYKEIRRTSNLPYKCPLKKNLVYNIQNYSVDSSKVPPYFPEVQFTLSMEFFYEGVKTMVAIPQGRIVRVKPQKLGR